MRRIELSAQAQMRLEEITEYYIANESPERTIKVLDSFEESFLKIAEDPHHYKRYHSPEFINLDIRIFSHYKTYHIYFISFEKIIIVAEIFHLSQHSSKLKIDI